MLNVKERKYFLSEGAFISTYNSAKNGIAIFEKLKLKKSYDMIRLRSPALITAKPVDVMSVSALDSPSTYLLETSAIHVSRPFFCFSNS